MVLEYFSVNAERQTSASPLALSTSWTMPFQPVSTAGKQAGTYLNPSRAITAKHDMAKFRSHGHLGSHHYTIVHIILLIG